MKRAEEARDHCILCGCNGLTTPIHADDDLKQMGSERIKCLGFRPSLWSISVEERGLLFDSLKTLCVRGPRAPPGHSTGRCDGE